MTNSHVDRIRATPLQHAIAFAAGASVCLVATGAFAIGFIAHATKRGIS